MLKGYKTILFIAIAIFGCNIAFASSIDCTCNAELTIDIGESSFTVIDSTEYEVDISDLYQLSLADIECSVHITDEDKQSLLDTASINYSILNESGGSGTIQDDTLYVSNIENKYTAQLEIVASLGDTIEVSDTINIDIQREFSNQSPVFTLTLPDNGEPASDENITIVLEYSYDKVTSSWGVWGGSETETITGEVVSKTYDSTTMIDALNGTGEIEFHDIGFEFPASKSGWGDSYTIENKQYVYKIYYTYEGKQALIGEVSVDSSATTAEYTLDEFPTCTCYVTITDAEDYTDTLGTEISTEMPFSSFATVNVELCPFHDTVDNDLLNIEYSIDTDNEVGGLSNIDADNEKIIIELEDTTYTSILTIKAEYKGTNAEETITISLSRQTSAPTISSWDYDPVASTLELIIKPNGNREAKVYIDDTLIDEITFSRSGGFMGMGGKLQNYTLTVDSNMTTSVIDTVIPMSITNIQAKRSDTDPTKIVVTWDDLGDNNNYITVKTENTDGDIATTQVNIKSSDTVENIAIFNQDNADDTGTVLVSKTATNYIELDLVATPYNSLLTFESYDYSNNGPIITTYAIPHNVIYTTVIGDDTGSVEEGKATFIRYMDNDVHDTAFDVPALSSVEIILGENGEAKQVNLADLGLVGEDGTQLEGFAIQYTALNGWFGEAKVRYTYEQVREDIPAAVGIITITVREKNTPPIAYDDGLNETEIIDAKSGGTVIIPMQYLRDNDYDRDTATEDLIITEVIDLTSGEFTIDYNSDTIKLELHPTFYGLIHFKYKLSDGELESENYASVTIDVEKIPNPPIAKDITSMIEPGETIKSVALNVDNTGGVEYTVLGIQNIKVNSQPVQDEHKLKIEGAVIESSGGNQPYIKITVSDGTILKSGDIITFKYTVGNEWGESTASATITVTDEDDPLDKEGYLYVHRKPIASFAPIITLDSTKTYVKSVVIQPSMEFSYDLDHNLSHASKLSTESDAAAGEESRPDYSWMGVRAWEWSIKTASGTWNTKVFDAEGKSGGTTNYKTADAARLAGIDWIQSTASTLISELEEAGTHETVIISLRVRDIDGPDNLGVWSDQRVVTMTAVALPPVAMFTLDNTVYKISNETASVLDIKDLSYDPNGDDLKTWTWVLYDGNGSKLTTLNYNTSQMADGGSGISTSISAIIKDKVMASSYNPKSAEFKLELIVTEDTNDALKSTPYSLTFEVYRDNDAPEFNDSSTSMDLEGSTVYQIDDGADGVVGDNWGTASNTQYPGTLDFKNMFKITDDQSTSTLKISWLFEGENILTRKEWSEDRRVILEKSYSNKSYQQVPFSGTVTAEGFVPGAYRISVSAKDTPSGNMYQDGASKTSYWITYGEEPDAPPYHMYVVPKLDIYPEIHFDEWVISGEFVGGVWQDSTFRESDGVKLSELGLELEDIVPTIGDTFQVEVVTNQYVTSLNGYEDYDGNGKYTAGEKKFPLSIVSTDLDGTITWRGDFTIEDIDDAEEGELLVPMLLRIQGETIWGSETGDVTRTKEVPVGLMVLPVRLYDFRVTSITDTNISTDFTQYINKLVTLGDKLDNGKVTDGALVGRLAVDTNSKATIDNVIGNIRKGYSFYFSLNSKGLTKDSDEIRIYPKLYALTVDSTGTIKTGKELIGLVPNSFGKYIPYTDLEVDPEISETYKLYYEGDKITSLNSHSDIRIPISLRVEDGSEQTWYGRYGIPSDARFFYEDEYDDVGASTKIEWTGNILVTFEIEAYKDGRSRYNYVERGQWEKERDIIIDTYKKDYITQEEEWFRQDQFIGAVIVYDGSKSIRDDYTSNPVWNE